MTALEHWVVLLNIFLSLSAGLVNAYVASKVGVWWRKSLVPVALLALIYSVSYVYLFVTDDVTQWSSTMRGVSLLAWPVAWTGPAIAVFRVTHSMHKVLDQATRSLTLRYEDEDADADEEDREQC
jgi:hypothetical protein